MIWTLPVSENLMLRGLWLVAFLCSFCFGKCSCFRSYTQCDLMWFISSLFVSYYHAYYYRYYYYCTYDYFKDDYIIVFFPFPWLFFCKISILILMQGCYNFLLKFSQHFCLKLVYFPAIFLIYIYISFSSTEA